MVKVKYQTTVYDKANPFGKDKTAVAVGEQCEKPSYLAGCDNGYMFIRTAKGIIHIIEESRILEINGREVNA